MEERKRGAVQKLVADKEREKRKCNIAIKGINWKGDKDIEKGKEWTQKFIKEKIDVEVISWRISGLVVIIKVDNEKMKREVMKNKNKLRRGKIFFENDLNFDERKTI